MRFLIIITTLLSFVGHSQVIDMTQIEKDKKKKREGKYLIIGLGSQTLIANDGTSNDNNSELTSLLHGLYDSESETYESVFKWLPNVNIGLRSQINTKSNWSINANLFYNSWKSETTDDYRITRFASRINYQYNYNFFTTNTFNLFTGIQKGILYTNVRELYSSFYEHYEKNYHISGYLAPVLGLDINITDKINASILMQYTQPYIRVGFGKNKIPWGGGDEGYDKRYFINSSTLGFNLNLAYKL